MSIDKSLSQYQQLVKKGKGNRRPGYRGDNWGGPSYGASSSKSSSGGNGSHDRGGAQHRAAAQKAAPAKAPEPDRQDRARQQAAAEQAAREIEERETAREKAIQVAALTPKKIEPVRSAHVDTPTQIAEQKEIDLYGYQDAKAKAPTTLIPKTVTYDRGVPFTDTPIKTTVGQTLFDPRTSQNTLLDRGGIFSNFDPKEMAKNQATKMVRNKIMKELGLTTLNPFIGIGSWLLGKFAPNKKAALTQKLKSTIKPTFDKDSLLGTPDWQGEKKRNKTFHKGEGGEKQQVSTVEEAISGKKALGIDFDELRKKQFIMKNALDEGYYTDNEGRTIQLTDEQKSMLKNYITRIDQYLVDPRAMSAYGGRIDKALGGRVRDI